MSENEIPPLDAAHDAAYWANSDIDYYWDMSAGFETGWDAAVAFTASVLADVPHQDLCGYWEDSDEADCTCFKKVLTESRPETRRPPEP